MDTPIVYFNLTSSEYRKLVSMLNSKKNTNASDPFINLVNKLIVDHSTLLQEVTSSCHIQFIWANKEKEIDDEDRRKFIPHS